jgi:predicted SAM-dependent methyltransferase
MNPVVERLLTDFGTTLYLDEPTGELRHGAVGHSPRNVLFSQDAGTEGAPRTGRLMGDVGGELKPIVLPTDVSLLTPTAQHSGGAPAPIAYEIIPLDGEKIEIRAAGLSLLAEIDGRLVLSSQGGSAGNRFAIFGRNTAPMTGGGSPSAVGNFTLFPGPGFTRYHFGCGRHFVPGYLNIDLFPDVDRGKIYQVANPDSAFVLNHDLSSGLPGCDNSLDVIYHCHFLEHLAYPDAIKLLRLCRLRLKPGGRMRLVVPDLELWIENYHANRDSFFDAYRRQALGNNDRRYPTKGLVFMGMLHNHGHRWGYDHESIQWLLEETGFVNVTRTLFQESALNDIAVLEPYTALRGMESLCVECEKPDIHR